MMAIDELHAVLDISQAGFRAGCKRMGVNVANLRGAIEDKGGDWNLFVYTADVVPEGSHYLRITIEDTTGKSYTPQLSRVELGYMD